MLLRYVHTEPTAFRLMRFCCCIQRKNHEADHLNCHSADETQTNDFREDKFKAIFMMSMV